VFAPALRGTAGDEDRADEQELAPIQQQHVRIRTQDLS
jgi:hypothetical protein